MCGKLLLLAAFVSYVGGGMVFLFDFLDGLRSDLLCGSGFGGGRLLLRGLECTESVRIPNRIAISSGA